MRSLLTLFIFFFGVCAQAADWEYVAATGASNVYVDLASVKERDANSKSAWFLFDHLDTRYDTDAASVFRSSVQLIEIDCPSHRLNWSRIEMYAGPLGTGRKVSARNINNQAAAFMESVQDSARASMATSICEAS